MPRLLRDIIQALVRDEADIRVAAIASSQGELFDHIGSHPTDVVIIGCDKNQMDEVSHGVFKHIHRTRVIAVTATDCAAVLYRLTPVSQSLGPLSPESLLSAIRESETEPADGGPGDYGDA